MADDLSLDMFDTGVVQRARVSGRTTILRLPVLPYADDVPAVTGSDTSEAAAQSMRPHVGKMQARILELLDERATMTCDELECITEWAHQSASARLRELVIAELVVDTGMRRKGRSGRTGRVYRKVRV